MCDLIYIKEDSLSCFKTKTSRQGPAYSADSMRQIRSVLSAPGNTHYYGSTSANTADRAAVYAALNHERLTAQQARHIRSGAEYIRAPQDELPPGFVSSAKQFYARQVDVDGHKVVDMRSWR